MVRATKLGSVVVSLAASGLAFGQSALLPASPSAQPAGKIITVSEPGKPAQKCRLIRQWMQPNGGKACQVQAVDSGEYMTIVQSGPATGNAKTMAMTIYHWTGATPHPQAPLPPLTKTTTPIVQTGGAYPVMQQPMPSTPVITTPSNVNSAFAQQSVPMPPNAGAPQRAPGPMTPGGVVLAPAPAGMTHDCGNCTTGTDCGTCGDCCTTCKPSLLERIKGCFHKNCDTGCCPDACTTCTPDSKIPVKTASGEMVVPVPTTQTMPAEPTSPPRRPVSRLFQRRKPADNGMTMPKSEMASADAAQSDPLKNPAAYGPSKTTAELAGAPGKVDLPNSGQPMMANGKVPLGAGSVMQAGGDSHYLPVPIVTLPDVNHMPQPPAAQVPNAPQPNQRYMANAFSNGAMPTPPPMAMGERSGNAFGDNPYAAEMAQGAFHHGMPNASGGMMPGFVPPGYAAMNQGYAMPAMPQGAAIQPGFYGPPRGQGVAPAGYQMQTFPPMQRSMQQSSAAPVDTNALLSQLRDAMLPSQREWAADKLTEVEWRHNAQIVECLVQSAKDDPAASVRAGCVHSLAKMGVNSPAVVATLNSLKSDGDPRVQQEAAEALAKLAPGQSPMMLDPAVQPAGGVVPPKSN